MHAFWRRTDCRIVYCTTVEAKKGMPFFVKCAARDSFERLDLLRR